MFFEPSTQREFASIDAFRLAHKDTSFGDLYTEAGRNEAGLFLVADSPPEYDPLANSLVRGGIELVDGNYRRQYTLAPSAMSIAEVRAAMATKIKAVRDRKTQLGGYQTMGKWFHSDTFSRSQQLGLVMMGASIPAGLMWKTMDGSYVEMTQTLAASVFQAAVMQDSALFARADQLIEIVNTSPSPAGVNIEAGWAATYNNI